MPRPSQQGLYWEIPTLVFTPDTAPSPNYGSLYSFQVTVTGGTGPYTITQTSGTLPSGVTFSAVTENTAQITGTVGSTGSFTFTLHAVDHNGYTADHTYSFSVDSPTITVLPSTLPNATAPANYSTLIRATGGIEPYTFDVLSGSLPSGLSLSSGGEISGIASVPGTYNFVIRATDASSNVGTQSYIVTINDIDRAIAKEQDPPKVMVVYDLAETQGYYYAGYGYYFNGQYSYPQNGGADVNPITIAQSIANRETALGFVTTVVTSYAQLAAMSMTEINKFSHIWDIGYHSVISNQARSIYTQYLQAGGALFLLGENLYFLARDTFIANTIDDVTTGVTINATTQGLTTITERVADEFLLANNRYDVTFYAPNFFSGYGTGTPIANSQYGPSAVVWKTGSLASAPAGAVVSVLDINFIVNPAYGTNNNGATWQPWFVDNLSLILNKK